ncbi:SDR family oxidoreductase [Actinocorallia populi]|uniref:SDR family oxidoreductase n=1 Tax=Actinocorallia populi TaxID=2079200 RepID=UPI000D092C94|nr:SDR family oxidoreductase [Actinocorallia populi]
MTKNIGVTGATGSVGAETVRLLVKEGHAPRLIVRDASRAPELPDARVAPVTGGYADTEGMREAFDGLDAVLLVSARESADRVAEHRSAVDAAVAAGVRHLVYLSFLSAAEHATFTFARDHWATEEYVKASGLDFTFLRPSLYQDVLPHLVQDGAIRGPAGNGRCAWVARTDVAAVAAAILPHAALHRGRRYDVTGPQPLTMAQTAEMMGVGYVPETVEEAYASRARYGAPDWEVAGWVTSYEAIATGEMDIVSPTVQRATGYPATSLQQFLNSLG